MLPSYDTYRTAAQEDRCSPRMRIAIPASLRGAGGRSFQTIVRDLSTSGFSASAINRMSPGMVCWLTLPGIAALQAEVAWWDNSQVGGGFAQLLSPIILDNLIERWGASAARLTIP